MYKGLTLRGRSYEYRMAVVGVTSLSDRREDMTVKYRIMSGKDKLDPRTFFDMAEEGEEPRRTRLAAGVHIFQETRSRLDISSSSFSQTVSSNWNSLPTSLRCWVCVWLPFLPSSTTSTSLKKAN